MKKGLKNSLFLIFAFVIGIASIFVGNSFVGFESKTNEAAYAAGDEIEISTAAELKNLVNTYGIARSTANFVLTNDIDMQGETLYGGIGTGAIPFAGTFNGKGHKISNLNFDLSKNVQGQDVVSTNKYAGLFGVTDGAKISNLCIDGTTSFTVGQCTNVYAGSLVGQANNTSISYLHNFANMSFDSADVFANNVYVGSLIGMANDCSVTYVVSRSNNLGTWTLSDASGKITNAGGVIGYASSTSMLFCVGLSKLKLVLTASYVGRVNVGGVIGYLTQNGSSLIDCVIDNNFDITNLSLSAYGLLYVGQLVGVIASPVPQSANLAYVYYRTNSTAYDVFGDQGSYTFVNESSKDNLKLVTQNFSNADVFNNLSWHFRYGNWDFSEKWYFNAATIYLQAFYGSFTIQVGSGLVNGNVLELKQDLNESYSYGESAEIAFGFKVMVDGSRNIDLSNYYTLTYLTLGGSDILKITEKNGVYSFADSDKYTLTTSGTNFVVTIKNVNLSTASFGAAYDIRTQAREFGVDITSKLYSADGELEVGKIPAYVYYNTSNPVLKELLQIKLNYDTSAISIDKRLVSPNSPYAFLGWYMENEDGRDIELSTNSTLSINFGHGYFVDSCKVYAKYQDDACMVTFKMDAGIKEIHLYSGGVVVNKDSTAVAISKKLNDVKLEIYVNDKYDFDVSEFIASLDTYKSSDAERKFCIWLNENDPDRPENYYSFSLDMTTLTGDFSDAFTISAQTQSSRKNSSMMTWIIAGSSAGGVLLIVAIIIIVVVVKKRRGGFGGGYSSGSSFKKSSYKDFY